MVCCVVYVQVHVHMYFAVYSHGGGTRGARNDSPPEGSKHTASKGTSCHGKPLHTCTCTLYV